ncbi:hypothetical protein M413DRAFT_11333 [Hebeloma cylindrosporum]|uniref:Uncharacterized protein n=1 Tax=Hebeloma cylindrosporum TaxID=76867 RepID=A0A0C3CC41_HEBCY|nr:hypothetical protein M413DRAFT_11333 [Hebeloma cylindrosporum h7]
MFHISSRSEKSKATLKPQPAQRYHNPNAELAEEMEVDSLVTPKATATASNPSTTQPESPTSQPTVGGTSKALPPGLNFSKAVTAGEKGKKRAREAEDPDTSPSKRMEMDTTPPAYGGSGTSTPHSSGSLASAATGTAPPPATVHATPAAAVSVTPAASVSAAPPTVSTAPATIISATPAALGGTPAVIAGPNGPGSGNAATANNTIYHQIGQPHLTGPNPLPHPIVNAAPPLQPANPLNQFYPPAKYELVPRPDGGFPRIRGHTYKTIRAHLDPTTLRLWEKQTGPGLIAFSPSDNGAVDPAKVIIFREMLRDALLAPSLIVIAPSLVHTHYTDHKPVTPYYIGGITDFQRTLLLHWNVWATPKAVFFIAREDNFVSNYLMTLENTFLDNDDASIAKVTSALITTIMEEDRHVFEDFIEDFHDSMHDHYTTDDVLDDIVNGLRVVPLQITERGAPITLFNVYAPSPTKDGDAYDQWLSLFRNRTYEFYGTATARRPYNCGTCSGQDHPTGKCPYHDLPGWHKPATNNSKYDKPINMNGKGPYDNGNGSTSRGWGSRGRGRGGGRGGQNRGRARGGNRGGYY